MPVTLIALAALSMSWTPSELCAQDRWTTPYPGVRQLVRRAAGPRDVFALEIDLCASGVSLRATRESERRATVPTWATARGVEVAVNADFFSYETYLPSGAVASNGVAWGNPDSRGNAVVAFGADRLALSRESEVLEPLPSWIREAIGGHPSVLRGGAVIDQSGDLCTARHPRTALGFSRDGQTLYLLVVDGRTSRSIGMTCEEEAATLRDLGAWDAVNLDGGGSSTMWVRGTGTLNEPSDGAPRTVSNHLGVQATGSGMPSSCMPYEPEEDALIAGSVGTSSTDLDGDARPDLCARAAAGILCVRATGAPFGAAITGPELSDATGWSDPANFETIVMGDVTGDGLADVCARANAGIRCYPSTGEGFGVSIVGPTLSDDSGWAGVEHYGTIRLADVDGDGDDDLCARAAAGVRCWPSNGAGFDAPWEAIAATADAQGFGEPSRWSTIRMGDVTGDGLADVCARTTEGVRCWASTGMGFDPEAIEGPGWSDASGWSAHEHYATIRMADVDGDGREDVCARGAAGLRCHLSTGAGFGAAIALDALSDDNGWADLSNYATIALADVDGDGDRDVCGRADAGVYCWLFDAGAFGARIDGPALSDDGSWWRAVYFRTLRFGDVDGDGDDDLCARGASGVRCWPAEGTGFGAALEGPAWSDESGWWAPRFHTTMRLAGPRRMREEPPPPDEPDAGDVGGADAGVGPGTADVGMFSSTLDAGARADAPTGSTGPGTITMSGCSASRGAPGRAGMQAMVLAALVLLRRRRSR